jgi:16S rRNA G966 N2-methylase RsmD
MQDEKSIEKALELIRRGYSKEKILRKVRGFLFSSEDIYEVARCRIKAREKFGEIAEKLYFDEIGLRYSTPRVVAEYRADRLRCESIADISCGIGAQLLFFAMKCGKVYGVEIDRRRALLARLNARVLNLGNVEIIEGDALSNEVVKKLGDAEVVFSDPARPPQENLRTLESLKPNPILVHEIYRSITQKIAFELPPQLPPERIQLVGEKEYTSFNFRLNRLALYTGELAECKVSAISLPSRERVRDEDEEIEVERASKLGSLIYEVDPAVVKAKLLPNLLGKLSFPAKIVCLGKRTLLTSDEVVNSEFLRRYSVLKELRFEIGALRDSLRELNAGKVTLRFSLPPSEYWGVRKRIEEGLDGERWVYLFKIDDKAVIAEL